MSPTHYYEVDSIKVADSLSQCFILRMAQCIIKFHCAAMVVKQFTLGFDGCWLKV